MFSNLQAFCRIAFTLWYAISIETALSFVHIFPNLGIPYNPWHSTYAMPTTLGTMRLLHCWRQSSEIPRQLVTVH